MRSFCGNRLYLRERLDSFTQRSAVELSVISCQMRATGCSCLRVQTEQGGKRMTPENFPPEFQAVPGRTEAQPSEVAKSQGKEDFR